VAENLVELIGVRRAYRFGEAVVNALDGLDFAIERGAFVGIIGRSGSGKSTLLNILGGLDRPSRGEVLVEGTALHGRKSDALATYRRETVGFIFQSFNLIAHLTALENVALPLRLAGNVGFFERRRRAKELLEEVGLGDRVEHKPAELSGGERQRVAIARALANDPSLLLADEPTGNLDSKTADEIMEMIQQLHGKGRTVVLVTHDKAQAERYCQRLIVLQDGKVLEDRAGGATAESPAPSRVDDLEAEVARLQAELEAARQA
jgi:putative ABC transport system ATP-binding protein